MVRIVSKRHAGRTVTLTDARVAFGPDGLSVGIVGRGFDDYVPPQPLDEAAIAKARRMPEVFELIEETATDPCSDKPAGEDGGPDGCETEGSGAGVEDAPEAHGEGLAPSSSRKRRKH